MHKSLFFLLAVVAEVPLFFSPVSGEVNRHLQISKEWRESFRVLSARLESQQIGSVAKFIEDNIVKGKLRPDCNMIEVLEYKNVSKLLLMIPVFGDERQFAFDWEDISFSPPAQFLPAIRSIMVSGDAQYSRLGKAIVLSREYARAYYILNEKYEKGEYWVMERDAQTFQNNFMSFLGGERYRKYIYAQAKKIIDGLNINKKLVLNFILVEPTEYDNKLDTIFRKPASYEEAMCIQKAVWRHIVFVVIENTAKKGRAGMEKVEFIRSLDFYKEGKFRKESLDYPDYGKIRKR